MYSLTRKVDRLSMYRKIQPVGLVKILGVSLLQAPMTLRTEKVPLVLFALVGISAWVEVICIFSQLGNLRKELPESWTLASFLTMIVQIANIGPLVYTLLPKKPALWKSMIAIMVGGLVSMLMVAFLHPWTAFVLGSRRSVGLFLSAFIGAIADTSSNMVFWAYAGSFGPAYIGALAFGEAISSSVSVGFRTLQALSGFSPTVYFLCIAGVVSLCLCALLVLHYVYEPRIRTDPDEEAAEAVSDDGNADISTRQILTRDWPILIIVFWLSYVQNGFTPAVLMYASKPYGDNAYTIAQNILLCATPVASAAASWLKPRRFLPLSVALFTVTTCAVFLLAFVDSPPFAKASGGVAFVTSVAVVSGASVSFTKCGSMLWLRERSGKADPRRALEVAGVAMQAGSFTGALSWFLLINVGKIFG